MDIDKELKNFSLHSVACCEDCRLAAEREREARKAAEAGHYGAPDHVRDSVLAEHDRRIMAHEKGMRAHARRAAWAEEGFMIDGPDERTDSDHARRYGSLQAALHAAGRVRHFDTYDDDLGDEDGEEANA